MTVGTRTDLMDDLEPLSDGFIEVVVLGGWTVVGLAAHGFRFYRLEYQTSKEN